MRLERAPRSLCAFRYKPDSKLWGGRWKTIGTDTGGTEISVCPFSADDVVEPREVHHLIGSSHHWRESEQRKQRFRTLPFVICHL
jgi:hypothetical protein